LTRCVLQALYICHINYSFEVTELYFDRIKVIIVKSLQIPIKEIKTVFNDLKTAFSDRELPLRKDR